MLMRFLFARSVAAIQTYLPMNSETLNRDVIFDDLSTTANDTYLIGQILGNTPSHDWIPEDTAILITHGIGNQRPLETLDAFATNLIRGIGNRTGMPLSLEHRSRCEQDSQTGGVWFNNFVRIRKADGSGPVLDVYEYYWAYHAENRASFTAIRSWLRSVVGGARAFYAENERLCLQYEKESFFTKKKNDGTVFRSGRYMVFLYVTGLLMPGLQLLLSGTLRLLGRLPFAGNIFEAAATWVEEELFHNVANVLGDVTIYNTSDEKSKYNIIRRKILNGAIEAVRALIEPTGSAQSGWKWKYDRVILAGHSLGTQITYDAINRMNFLVQAGEIKGIGTNGILDRPDSKSVDDLLAGFVTFGSPLDKIAFFLRDQAPKDQALRQAILNDYYGFRQRLWNPVRGIPVGTTTVLMKPEFQRLFESIPWRNYFDPKDPVSGSLDFYRSVTNVKCDFTGRFTHSHYWTCDKMFEEIYQTMLVPARTH